MDPTRQARIQPPHVPCQRQRLALQRSDAPPVGRCLQLVKPSLQAPLLLGQPLLRCRARGLPRGPPDQRGRRGALPLSALALVPGLPRRGLVTGSGAGQARRTGSVPAGAGGAARCMCVLGGGAPDTPCCSRPRPCTWRTAARAASASCGTRRCRTRGTCRSRASPLRRRSGGSAPVRN